MLDNASIHRAATTQRLASQLGFEIIWNVPYHPEFNGIEYVWNIAKQLFREVQLQRMLQTTNLSFNQAIWQSLNDVPPDEVKRCIRHGIANLNACSQLPTHH